MQKQKRCQRRVRFPDDVKLAIEEMAKKNAESSIQGIYQLRKVYGLTGEKNSVA
ncbi:Arc family DNA binding domain-containing protein [Escherichia coli]|nr:Arc family DNA binding domain-containing protein [Escherichia coli]